MQQHRIDQPGGSHPRDAAESTALAVDWAIKEWRATPQGKFGKALGYRKKVVYADTGAKL